MRYDELALAHTERHADTDVATLFVPFGAEQRLLSLCASHYAQILAVRALAKPFRGFSVDLGSSDYSGAELLAAWADAAKVLEEART